MSERPVQAAAADYGTNPNPDEIASAGPLATYSSRGRRVTALVIDMATSAAGAVAVGVACALGMAMQGLSRVQIERTLHPGAGRSVAAAVVALVVYRTVAEGVGDATLGKLVCGLRVRQHGDLVRCGWRSALIRSSALLIDLSFFGLPALSSMHDDPKLQRLGDVWAGTVVVRAHDLPTRQSGDLGRAVGGVALALAARAVVDGLLRYG